MFHWKRKGTNKITKIEVSQVFSHFHVNKLCKTLCRCGGRGDRVRSKVSRFWNTWHRQYSRMDLLRNATQLLLLQEPTRSRYYAHIH